MSVVARYILPSTFGTDKPKPVLHECVTLAVFVYTRYDAAAAWPGEIMYVVDFTAFVSRFDAKRFHMSTGAAIYDVGEMRIASMSNGFTYFQCVCEKNIHRDNAPLSGFEMHTDRVRVRRFIRPMDA